MFWMHFRIPDLEACMGVPDPPARKWSWLVRSLWYWIICRVLTLLPDYPPYLGNASQVFCVYSRGQRLLWAPTGRWANPDRMAGQFWLYRVGYWKVLCHTDFDQLSHLRIGCEAGQRVKKRAKPSAFIHGIPARGRIVLRQWEHKWHTLLMLLFSRRSGPGILESLQPRHLITTVIYRLWPWQWDFDPTFQH